jgi:AraC-like DNA-binding protein
MPLLVSDRRPALPGCRLFQSSEVDETRERISVLMQPHELTPTQPIRSLDASVDFLELADMGVGVFRLGPMAVSIDSVAGYHLLILCLRGAARVRRGRNVLDVGGSQGACFAPGDPLHAEFSSDCEQLVWRIGDDLMRRAAGGRVRLNPVLSLERPELQPWLKTLSLVLGQADMICLMRRDPMMAGGFQTMLTHSLLDGQAQQATAEAPAPRAVRRARDFMEASFDLPLDLAAIAEAAEAPGRTLCHQFQRFCGQSPMQYLKDLRLAKAHERLIRGGASVTVASIAMDCGFAHLGRFAEAYRARFGQAPSATLSRSVTRLSRPN